MDYLLFFSGKIPEYLIYCLNTIKSVDKESQIYLCTDQNIKTKNINIINFSEVENLIEKKNQLEKIYRGTKLEKNPLWVTSLLRVYSLNEMSNHLSLNKFIHFDTDVLIYKPFSEINKMEVLQSNKVNITANERDRFSFGYSYFDNKKNINKLCEIFDLILKERKYYTNEYSRGLPLTEMKMLKIAQELNPDLFHELPILPYSKKKIIFDPASYGQYLDGTHINRGNYILKRRFVSSSHIVGRELKSKRIKVQFRKKLPVVEYEGVTTNLANLHIHSKRLHKFLPKNYGHHIDI